MLVAFLPIVRVDKSLQNLNAISPIVVTELGMEMLSKEQDWKAPSPIVLTEFPIVTVFKPQK